MKIIKLMVLLLVLGSGVFCRDNVFAAQKDDEPKKLSGKMGRIEEDIEDLDRKLSKCDVESKKYLSLKQQRDRLALSFIHEAQFYLQNNKNKKHQKSAAHIKKIIKNEIVMLEEFLGKEKSFPYFKYLDKPDVLLNGIRAGKIKYANRLPRRDDMLLREIQEAQRKALADIHKAQMKERRN